MITGQQFVDLKEDIAYLLLEISALRRQLAGLPIHSRPTGLSISDYIQILTNHQSFLVDSITTNRDIPHFQDYDAIEKMYFDEIETQHSFESTEIDTLFDQLCKDRSYLLDITEDRHITNRYFIHLKQLIDFERHCFKKIAEQVMSIEGKVT